MLASVSRPAPVAAVSTRAAAPPNIVLILTDDQRYDSLGVMPNVQQRLMKHGITFDRAFVSNSLCCPSRASILTGGLSHTTKVWTNVYTKESPYGGFKAFHLAGDENGTIALALHDAGYRTALFGKYLNSYAGPYVPPGWDDWGVFSGTANGGAYYRYHMYDHHGTTGHLETHGHDPSDYSTTVIEHKAINFLRSTQSDTPFFLEVTPYAPHYRIRLLPRDKGTYTGFNVRLPRSFNEANAGKPAYIRQSPTVGPDVTEGRYNMEFDALQAVDRMVGNIVKELRATGRLNNTLIMFMSDNGIQMGEHRWIYKLVPYEESIRVPLVVRYPPMTATNAGKVSNSIVANVDLAPTFADVAGIPFQGVGTVDGVSMVPVLKDPARSIRRDLVLEHKDYRTKYAVPSYCGLRTPGWMYARYNGGFQELYRLSTDPHELRNVASDRPLVLSRLRGRTKSLCEPPPPGYTWP
jgi:arylsulfatase A-like enzyme